MKICGKAYAKLNISLDVTGKLPNGYHEISSVFQSVSLYDKIIITFGDRLTVMGNKAELPTNSDNLCYTAAQLFCDAVKRELKPEIYIEKNIPLAAGLGGGSADAAAVLRLLNTACGSPITNERLAELALKLGADVPFCLFGGTMLAEGVGEKLTPVNSVADYELVIIKQGEKPSTGALYSRLDSCEIPNRPDNAALINALKQGDISLLSKTSSNVFEFAWGANTALSAQKQLLLNAGAAYAGLSGSGPSVFGIFEKGKAAAAHEKAKQCFENVYLCKPVSCGVEITE